MIMYYTPVTLIPEMKVHTKILICYEYSNKFITEIYHTNQMNFLKNFISISKKKTLSRESRKIVFSVWVNM